MKQEYQRFLQLSLLVLAVVLVGTLVWWSDVRDSGLMDGRQIIELKAPDCSPRGAFCLGRANGFSVLLELDKTVTYLSPFGIKVNLSGD